jgi:hypothetical protein
MLMHMYIRDSVTSNERNRLSAERADVILKAVVKRFFNEKEVTSTLVMDALYSGCRALQTRATGGSGAHAGDVVMSVEHNEAHLAGDALRCVWRIEHRVARHAPPRHPKRMHG